MFDDGPKSQGVELFFEIMSKEISTNDGDAHFFGMIERSLGGIGADDLIIAGKTFLQLVEKAAGGATDVEDYAARTVSTEQAEFTPEADIRIIAFEFIA